MQELTAPGLGLAATGQAPVKCSRVALCGRREEGPGSRPCGQEEMGELPGACWGGWEEGRGC